MDRFPATNESGWRNRSISGEARTWPSATISNDGSGPAQLVGLFQHRFKMLFIVGLTETGKTRLITEDKIQTTGKKTH